MDQALRPHFCRGVKGHAYIIIATGGRGYASIVPSRVGGAAGHETSCNIRACSYAGARMRLYRRPD